MAHRRHYYLIVLSRLLLSVLLQSSIAVGQAPSAYLPEASFDFGSVRQGEVVEHRFAFRNTSFLPVKVEIMGISHPVMRVKEAQEVLHGAEGSITVPWETR